VDNLNLNAKNLQGLWRTSKGWVKNAIGLKTNGRPIAEVWQHRVDNAVSFCLVGGAMQVCDGHNARTLSLICKLDRRIKKLFPTRTGGRYSDAWTNVVKFNNDYCTTFEDIKLVIRDVRTPK